MFHGAGFGKALEHPLENRIGGHTGVETEDERDFGENEKPVFQNSEIAEPVASAVMENSDLSVAVVLENRNNDLQILESNGESDGHPESIRFSKGCSKPCSKAVPKNSSGKIEQSARVPCRRSRRHGKGGSGVSALATPRPAARARSRASPRTRGYSWSGQRPRRAPRSPSRTTRPRGSSTSSCRTS